MPIEVINAVLSIPMDKQEAVAARRAARVEARRELRVEERVAARKAARVAERQEQRRRERIAERRGVPVDTIVLEERAVEVKREKIDASYESMHEWSKQEARFKSATNQLKMVYCTEADLAEVVAEDGAIVLGAWDFKTGLQVGLSYTEATEETPSTVTGSPTYPLKKAALIQLLPDEILYDEQGEVIGTVPVTAVVPFIKLAGQADRIY